MHDDVFKRIERWCSPQTDGALEQVFADPELERACRERYAFLLAIDGVELERVASIGDCVKHLSPEQLLAELERIDGEVVPVDEVYDEWAHTLRLSPRTLSLRGQGRTHLPSALKLLPFLRRLDLSGNQLESYDPDPCRAGRLLELDLSSNRFSEFPERLGTLVGLDVIASVERGLERLDLRDNLLSEIPAPIAKLRKHLRVLYLDRNRFTAFPATVTKLKALVDGKIVGLEHLGLGENEISEVPASLGTLSCLRSLDLRGNQLASLPVSLSKLQLDALDLSNNRLEAFPAWLTEMKSLRSLALADNALGALPASLSKLSGLEMLDLRNTGLRELPAGLARLKKLHLLDLRGNSIGDLPAGLERDGLDLRV